MKKSFFSNLFISLSVLILITLTSCDNFFSGNLIQEELQELIDEANAPEVEIFISADEGSGSVAPNGIVTHKVGKSFPVIFNESKAYQFSHWEILDRETKEVLEDAILIDDMYDSETRFTVKSNIANMCIHPVCIVRPSIDRTVPAYDEKGVPKDSSIVITFSKNISKDNDLSKITITSGGVSVKDCYKTPVINNNILTFAPNNANLLDVSSGTKSLTVTIPGDFFYIDGKSVVSLGTDYSWSFKVNNSTDAKTEITFAVGSEIGKITPDGTAKYNIGETINLKFEAKDEYKFTGWNITGDDAGVLSLQDKTSSSTTARITGSGKGIGVTPNVIQLPRIKSVEPANVASGVNCYSPIKILFNMPMNKDSLHKTFSKISITNSSGADIRNEYFYLPELNDDGTLLIIRPRGDKIKNLIGTGALASIVVTLTDDISPAKDNGYKLEKYSFSYTINGDVPNNKKPILTAIELSQKGTEDTKLSNDAFNTEEWKTQDYISNYVCNSVYISCSGISSEVPAKSFIISEYLAAEKNGTLKTPETLINAGIELAVGDVRTGENENFTTDAVKYTLSSATEGVIRLSIRVKDNENRISDNELSCYVINDSKLEENAKLFFGPYIGKSGFGSSEDGYYYNSLRFADEQGNDNVPLHSIRDFTEDYYPGYYVPLNAKIICWDKGDSNKKTVYELNNFNEVSGIKDLEQMTFTRKAIKDTYVNLIISDNNGRTYTKEYIIPRSAEVAFLRPLRNVNNQNENKKKISAVFKNYDSLNSISNVLFIKKAGTNDKYEWDSNSPYYGIKNDSTSQLNSAFLDSDTLYEVCFSNRIEYKEDSKYYKNCTYGCIIDKAYFRHNSSTGKFECNTFISTKPVSGPGTSIIEHIKNSGKTKCKVDWTKQVNNDDSTYILAFNYNENKQGNTFNTAYDHYYCPMNKDEFYLDAGLTYTVGYITIDSNGMFSKFTPYGNATAKTLDLSSYTNKAPKFKYDTLINTQCTYSQQYRPNEFTYALGWCSDSSTMLDNNLGMKISNYIEKNPENNKDKMGTVVTEAIQNELNKKQLSFDVTNLQEILRNGPYSFFTTKLFHVPLDVENNEKYTLYSTLFDNQDNYTSRSVSLIDGNVQNISFKPYIDETANDLSKIYMKGSDNQKYIYDLKSVLFIKNGETSWTETVKNYSASSDIPTNRVDTPYASINLTDYTFDPTSHPELKVIRTFTGGFVRIDGKVDNVFTKSTYVHTSYLKESLKKCSNFVTEGVNGCQVTATSATPVLLQLLYSKYDYGNDAEMWATKGIEADVKYISTSNNYNYILSPALLDKIPSNTNYCIVLHLIDGSTLMTSVKQKK